MNIISLCVLVAVFIGLAELQDVSTNKCTYIALSDCSAILNNNGADYLTIPSICSDENLDKANKCMDNLKPDCQSEKQRKDFKFYTTIIKLSCPDEETKDVENDNKCTYIALSECSAILSNNGADSLTKPYICSQETYDTAIQCMAGLKQHCVADDQRRNYDYYMDIINEVKQVCTKDDKCTLEAMSKCRAILPYQDQGVPSLPQPASITCSKAIIHRLDQCLKDLEPHCLTGDAEQKRTFERFLDILGSVVDRYCDVM